MDELEIKNKFNEAEEIYLEYCKSGKKCDFKYLYELFNEYADKYNDANAKYYLGEFYYYGLYVDRNDEIAYYIFRELKDFYGDIRAKIYIGKMYYFGIYVKKDYKKAFNIFESIVEKYKNENNILKDTAQYLIGRMYYHGHYVESDYEMSFKIFNEILNREPDNIKLIQYLKYYIGVAYYCGNYVDQDYQKAFEMFNEISYDHECAQYYLGEMHYFGRYVEQDYEKAFKIFNGICNDEYAQYYLGKMYENGEYVEKNKEKGIEFYKKAAEADECRAIKRLIEINEEINNEEELIKYCDKLILIDDDNDAKLKMSELYWNKSQKILEEIRDNDDSLPYIQEIKEKTKKAKEAVEILKKCISYGNEAIKFDLGYMYIAGEFIEENMEEGLKIYEELSKNEIVEIRREAKFVLGSLYYEGEENGMDIKDDKEKGLKLLEEAAKEGAEKAVQRLNGLKSKQ